MHSVYNLPPIDLIPGSRYQVNNNFIVIYNFYYYITVNTMLLLGIFSYYRRQ